MPYPIQRLLAAIGLVVVSPVIIVLALAVRVTSGAPMFFRATRTGPTGTFTLIKLRTMRTTSGQDVARVTASGDIRVTPLGRRLRRTKLDELPQLWNVARGDMALVGPRPEDPKYVDL